MKRLIVEKEKVLPLCNNAKIKYDLMLYMEMEALLSNIKTRDSAKAWYMTNYTQLYCLCADKLKVKKGAFYKNAHISQIKNPFIKERITFSCFCKPSSILNFIINQISKENYIKILLDHFYLPNYKFYNSKHVFHTEFIYGYDLSKNVLYIIGSNNLKLGGFARTQVSFDDIVKSYESSKYNYPYKSITILSIKERKKYVLNINKLYKGLLSYYNSSPQFSNLFCAFNDKHSFHKVYGLNTYNELYEVLKCEFVDAKKSTLKSIKFLQAFADFKKLMLYRIYFLYQHHLLIQQDFDFIYNNYKKVVDGFEIIISLYIKFYIKSDYSNSQKILNMLFELKKTEREIIKMLILSISTQKNLYPNRGECNDE